MDEFTTLNRDLLRKIVPQRMEIFFKYTGQALTCYPCGSTDDIAKNCLKQRMWFGHIRVKDHGLNDPPPPNNKWRLTCQPPRTLKTWTTQKI